MMKYLLLWILPLLIGCLKAEDPASKQLTPSYLVTKVSDGDTFWVDDHSLLGLKIRLIGIDAPESQDAFARKEEPWGLEAKEFLTYLIFNLSVQLEFDLDSLDIYGRTLAYAYLADGSMVNEIIVEQGYARVATYPPNSKYETLFIAAEERAKLSLLGIWHN
ncbi:thermonuclease family protein [Sphingobacteriaceae bacterium WQ 2009]|uniref:Thermonuclease family protein n=1 Tax=Rhinopithecimicrobium faecis TaxID=2820698 RepID=A0A8T4H7T1_9SPHI|nr:thermonuclease family protein [Sphingobacteriaceae bacterium WQ 2009]